MSTELNLLPPGRRHVLTRQLVWQSMGRALSSLSLGLLLLTIVGGVIGGSLQLAVWSYSQKGQTELDRAVARYTELRDAIAEQNAVLVEMSKLSNQRIIWSHLVQSLITSFPSGIALKNITAEASTRKLSFGGVAVARNTLIVLTERLKLLPWVAEVNAPLSNLVQKENPTFQIDLGIKTDAP